MGAPRKKGLQSCCLKQRNIRAFYFIKILSINKKINHKNNLMKIKKINQKGEKKILIKIMILMT
jgi:hypothetical protein